MGQRKGRTIDIDEDAAVAVAAGVFAAFFGTAAAWVFVKKVQQRRQAGRGPRAAGRGQRPSPADVAGLTGQERADLDLFGFTTWPSALELRAARNALIRKAHPDAGGDAGLAARINAAYDRLAERVGRPTWTIVEESHGHTDPQ